jgi:hypothetical protein
MPKSRFCLVVALLAPLAAACASDAGSGGGEPIARATGAIHSSHAGPAPWKHVLTCYGGCSAPHYDSSACGHNTSCGPVADGNWWYATERAAFHCGAKLKLERDGKCVVVDVEDNGPADWVESNSASSCGVGYIIDASPLVADYFGGGCGWGECFTVDVSPVSDDTPTGPCGVTAENCSSSQVSACGNFGCACVDGQCNGGFCPGGGCSAQSVSNCGAYGCQCVDGQCSGGFCPGSGCTAKETNDCAAFGCQCVDHQCSGGYCPGTGCTAKETNDCGAFGCGCVDHQCNGVFCPGSGCTAKQDKDCSDQGKTCSGGKCDDGGGGAGGGEGGAAGAGEAGASGSATSGGTGGDGGSLAHSGGHGSASGGASSKGVGGVGATTLSDDSGCNLSRGRAPGRSARWSLIFAFGLAVLRRRGFR